MPLRKLISSPEAERDVAPFSGSFTASDMQFRMAPEVQPSKVEIKVGDYYATIHLLRLKRLRKLMRMR